MQKIYGQLGAVCLGAIFFYACAKVPDDHSHEGSKDYPFIMSPQLKKIVHEKTKYSDQGEKSHRHKGFSIAFKIEPNGAPQSGDGDVKPAHNVFCLVSQIILIVDGEEPQKIYLKNNSPTGEQPMEVLHCIDPQ